MIDGQDLHELWSSLRGDALRRGADVGLPALAGGWGFACAMFYASFFSHLQHLDQPDRGPVEQLPLTITIGVLFVLTIAGFALALGAAARARAER